MTAWADPGSDRVDALLVEDSEDEADLIRRALAATGLGSHLAWARDGQQAADLIGSHHPGGPGRTRTLRG